MTDTNPYVRDERGQPGAQLHPVSTKPQQSRADETYRGLVNPSRPAGRYQRLDRNSDPARALPAMPDQAPVNWPRDPHCKEGF